MLKIEIQLEVYNFYVFIKLDFPKLHNGFDPKDVCFFKSRGLYLLIIFHILFFIPFYLFHMFLPTRRVILMIINMDWALHLILTNVKSSYHMTSMIPSGIYKSSWSLNSTGLNRTGPPTRGFFFSSEYCSTSRSALVDSAVVEPRIQKTADMEEPQIWRANCKWNVDFDWMEGWSL